MDDKEKRLRRKQEQDSVIAARKALDQGDAALATSIVGSTSEFWPQNLIILSAVVGFYSHDKALIMRAERLFYKYLGLCSNPNSLSQIALWMKNPVRARSIPDRLKKSIDCQQKKLDPSWNGVWKDSGTASTNRALELLKKSPHEVLNPNDCLMIANQNQDWKPWLARYYALGGNQDDPTYLKLIVAKAVPRHEEPSERVKGLLKKFTVLGQINEVRVFLRNITPTHTSLKGKDPNLHLARYALYLYASCERLDNTVKDWVHIGESALHLDDNMTARIIQRILLEIQRDSHAEEVLQRLIRRNGFVQVTRFARDDIGFLDNPVWKEIYSRIPKDASAKDILTAYARRSGEVYIHGKLDIRIQL